MKKTAHVRWIQDLQFVATSGSGHATVLDSGGEQGSIGPSPMELLLEGLAGCTAMDVVFILKKKRQKISGCEVHVEGVRAEEHPKIYTDIELTYTIRGKNLSEKAVHDAVKLSTEKYCSASAMLEKAARLTHKVVIVEDE